MHKKLDGYQIFGLRVVHDYRALGALGVNGARGAPVATNTQIYVGIWKNNC